ncbi:MAG: GGDEF domain-containing protein [Acidobacteriaceae bacterium]|nr:GGDEF domain-containing protein [Acidobacteriaceae bacterium]
MSVILVRLRRHEVGRVQPWAIALSLIAVEGMARMVYQMPTGAWLHNVMHIIALNAYIVAAVTFLYAADSEISTWNRPILYFSVFCIPLMFELGFYGARLESRSLYVWVGVVGLLATLVCCYLLRYPVRRAIEVVAIWVPLLVLWWLGDLRQATYTALSLHFALAGIAYYSSLPPSRKGRIVVVVGFFVWAGCFLFHPWITRSRHDWVPLLDQVWDLQKFVVMFGLLIVSLEENGARAEYESLHDELTGLANRRLFEDRLDQAIARARRSRTRLVVFNMDLNGFKQVNDTLGHSVGDELLCTVSDRLRTITRESDTLARVGGDEFLLIATDFIGLRKGETVDSLAAVRRQATVLAVKFREAIAQPVTLARSGTVIVPSLSVGFAIFPDEAKDGDALCQRADSEMYVNKHGQGDDDTPILSSAAG